MNIELFDIVRLKCSPTWVGMVIEVEGRLAMAKVTRPVGGQPVWVPLSMLEVVR